ncbi:MAG TPA: helix-turn-helix transcriptional regulator [Acidimicrobiales bacterium]
MRRKAGHLLVIEEDILDVALTMKAKGSGSFYGFAAAKLIQTNRDARRLTSQGTLYKALGRLERAGLLASAWEHADAAAAEGRPRRRLYHVTDLGERALAMTRAQRPLPDPIIRRLAPG